jgi:hypothetical protein
MGIAADSLRQPIEVSIELEARGQSPGSFTKLAAELCKASNLLVELAKERFPLLVALTKGRQVPRINGLYLGTLRKTKDFGHGTPWFKFFSLKLSTAPK